MKSIYLRNFVATATMVSVCFLLIAFSFVFIGRNYVISEYRSDMEASAKEVSRTASAIAADDELCPEHVSQLYFEFHRKPYLHYGFGRICGKLL